jgi:hypothetical protein
MKLKQNIQMGMRKRLFFLGSGTKRGLDSSVLPITPVLSTKAVVHSPLQGPKSTALVPLLFRKKLNGRSLNLDFTVTSKSVAQNGTKKLKRQAKQVKNTDLKPVEKYVNTVKLFRPDYTSTPNYTLPKTSTPVMLLKRAKRQPNELKGTAAFSLYDNKLIKKTTTTTTKRTINVEQQTGCNCHYYNSTFKDDFKVQENSFSSTSSCSIQMNSRKRKREVRPDTGKRRPVKHHDYVNQQKPVFYNYECVPTFLRTVQKTTTAKTTNIFLAEEYFHGRKETENGQYFGFDLSKFLYKKNSGMAYSSEPAALVKAASKNKRMKRLIGAERADHSVRGQKFVKKMDRDTKRLMQFENIIRC